MKKRPLLLAFGLLLCLALLLASAAAEVNPNSYKATITKVSVGAPITGLDGKKYIPVDVHFTSEADPDESGKCFLEGVIKAVHDGVENDVSGVGMTLMRVSGTPGNNQFDWDPNTKKGVAKFNIPVLDSGEAQTVEHSQATGQDEVNGLKEGNTAKISFESVVYGAEGCPVLTSNEAVFEYKPAELPKIIAYDSSEYWEWRFNAAQHWELCTEGDPAGQIRSQGPHTYNNSTEATDFSVTLPEGFDASKPLNPDNSPELTDGNGTACVFDGYGFKSVNAGGSADDSDPAPAPVYLSCFSNLKAGATVKARACDTCCYIKMEGGAKGQVDGASVSTDKMTAAEGEEVKISIVPESGRKIESVSAESGGQAVEIRQTSAIRNAKDVSETVKYYYTQPAGGVTITVTMEEPCTHPNAVTAFNHEGHWLYCPDCEMGIPDTFEEHFTDWRNTSYEGIETVRVTVPNMEQTDEIPADIAMGVGNTVQFLSEDMTFTYLPDDSGVISAKNDASESWYIPGGFAASHNDPWPEVTNKFSVMIPGAEMMMSMQYEDCGYGILEIHGGHGGKSKIWGDKWFAAEGETVTFMVNPQAGFRCNVVVRSGNTVIPYAAGAYDGEYTFIMPAGNVTLEVAAEPLPRLTLPGQVLTVEESAFEGCGAYFIVVPDGCTSIGAYAFRDCPNLEAVLIPATVTEIDATAFDGCEEVCIYGEDGSPARDYSYQHYNTYFFTIDTLEE